MSHRGLQRALVVALHDPGFVAAMHVAPDTTLAPFGLEAVERAQLLAVDPRAFGVDRQRARRVLRVVVDELPAASALALAASRRYAVLDRFFASDAFRAAILDDRPLVLAFAAYLGGLAGELAAPALPGVLAIEATRARARRAALRPPLAGVGLAPGVAVLASDASALANLHSVETYLFELGLMPHVALADDRPPMPALAPTGEPLWLLFRPAPGQIAIEAIDRHLFRALEGLAGGGAPDTSAAAARLATLGLPVSRPEHLVDELLADGLLLAS